VGNKYGTITGSSSLVYLIDTRRMGSARYRMDYPEPDRVSPKDGTIEACPFTIQGRRRLPLKAWRFRPEAPGESAMLDFGRGGLGVEVPANVERSRGYLWAVISVAFAAFLTRLNGYTVNVSLPTIARSFNVGTAKVSGVTIYYLLTITTALLVIGRLGDRIGLKRIFVSGYAVFVLGSLLCGLSKNLPMLIAFRCVQGGGAAMLLALSFAIVARAVPKERLGWAFGIMSTSAALGVAAGAPLGGLLAGYVSWRWVFLLNVPVALAAMVVSWQALPADDGRRRAGQHPADGPGGPSDQGGASSNRRPPFDILGLF
jgi:hypothetical protein